MFFCAHTQEGGGELVERRARLFEAKTIIRQVRTRTPGEDMYAVRQLMTHTPGEDTYLGERSEPHTGVFNRDFA